MHGYIWKLVYKMPIIGGYLAEKRLKKAPEKDKYAVGFAKASTFDVVIFYYDGAIIYLDASNMPYDSWEFDIMIVDNLPNERTYKSEYTKSKLKGHPTYNTSLKLLSALLSYSIYKN